MIERPIPQDVFAYKTKAIGNFSARELVFGAIGVAVTAAGIFGFFSFIEDTSMRALVSVLPALPFFLIGFVKIYNTPFEKIILSVIEDSFIQPPKRIKEVHQIEEEEYKKSKVINPKNKKKKKCKRSKTVKGIR